MAVYALVALVALTVGSFFGMRLQLARGRFRELRRGLDQARNEKSLENALVTSLEQRAAFEAADLDHHVRIINVVQFVLTWNWDISILLDLLRFSPEAWSVEAGWRRKLLARTVALVAYETLTKLDWVFDPAHSSRKRSVWYAVRALRLEAELGHLLLATHSDTQAVLGKHRALLVGIRNNIIGHRDHDASTQLLWMRKADTSEIEALGWELFGLTNSILDRFTAITVTLRQHTAWPTAE